MAGAAPAPAPARAPDKGKEPARRLGGGFLAGASGRLLPLSVPMRWFGAAAAFHALAWLALAAGAAGWSAWHGGLGWPLAALHGITLGTLVASAIGASLQLLPVASRQPVRWPRAAAALWWIYVPGVAALMLGMGLAQPVLLAAGAGAVLLVLPGWALLLAANLRGAKGMPGVVLHGRVAGVAVVLLVASAAALVLLWLGRPVMDRDAARALHLAAGVFGVMGMLVLGLATILLPMFALASVPAERLQLAGGAAGAAAVALLALAAFTPAGAALALRVLALLCGGVAFALHLVTMRRVLATGMRGDLGRTNRWLQLAWGSMIATAALAALALAFDDGRLGALFVLAAVLGWLGSFLFAMLHRLLPFLASLHAVRGAGRASRPPTPSALTLDRALAAHLAGHAAALALLTLAVATRHPAWLLAAATAGFAGAVAFIAFLTVLLLRLRRAAAAAAAAAVAQP